MNNNLKNLLQKKIETFLQMFSWTCRKVIEIPAVDYESHVKSRTLDHWTGVLGPFVICVC